MSSTTKTLALLSHFSTMRPEIGLSQLCRLAQRDKATTYRHLQALEAAGFIEQNPLTRNYRLGPALLPLAQTRELTVPRKSGAQAALAALADATGETVHVSVLSGDKVYALASCESPLHGTRAVIDIDEFPLHATASGLCAVAFGPARLQRIATQDMRSYTAATLTRADALSAAIDRARACGFAASDGSYSDDTQSVAAPLFDQTGHFAGAVSVACVATRFDAALDQTVRTHLVHASRGITKNWGGTIPPTVEAAWQTSHLSHPSPTQTLEPAT